jgi:hypothetical protein
MIQNKSSSLAIMSNCIHSIGLKYKDIQNDQERSNNKFIHLIYFLIEGFTHPHLLKVFLYNLNGRDLRKIRQSIKWDQSDVEKFNFQLTLRKKQGIKPQWQNLNSIQSVTINDFNFEIITSFPELDRMAKTLTLCSAGRNDLVEKFVSGEMLRFVISKKEEIVGTIAVYPSTGIKKFCFYGLGKNHINIHKKDLARGLDSDLLKSFSEFKKLIYKQKIVYQNQRLNTQNCYNPWIRNLRK